eukprot:UN02555
MLKPEWDTENLWITQKRQGQEIKSGTIVVWSRTNGGTIDGNPTPENGCHGRYDPSARPGDWELEDEFCIYLTYCESGVLFSFGLNEAVDQNVSDDYLTCSLINRYF